MQILAQWLAILWLRHDEQDQISNFQLGFSCHRWFVGLHDCPNESIVKHHSPRPIVPLRNKWTEKLVIAQSSSFTCLTTTTSTRHTIIKKKHQFAVGTR